MDVQYGAWLQSTGFHLHVPTEPVRDVANSFFCSSSPFRHLHSFHSAAALDGSSFWNERTMIHSSIADSLPLRCKVKSNTIATLATPCL